MESTDLYALVEDERVPHLVGLLEVRGLQDEDIQVRPAPPGRYELHDEVLYEEGISARAGLLAGAGVGVVIGLLMSLVIGWIDTGGEVVSTVMIFAGFAALVGGMAGLQRAETLDSDPVTYREVGADDHVSLVEVHNEHWNRRVHRILEHEDVVFVQRPSPV